MLQSTPADGPPVTMPKPTKEPDMTPLIEAIAARTIEETGLPRRTYYRYRAGEFSPMILWLASQPWAAEIIRDIARDASLLARRAKKTR